MTKKVKEVESQEADPNWPPPDLECETCGCPAKDHDLAPSGSAVPCTLCGCANFEPS